MFKRLTLLIASLALLTGCSETARAQRDYAHMLAKQGKHKQAVAFYSEAIRLDPKDPESYVWRATSYIALGEWQKTIDDCNKAAQLGAQTVPLYQARSAALLALNKPAAAMDDLNKAVTLSPGDSTARLSRALIAERLGLESAGVEDASKALTADPSLNTRYEEGMQALIDDYTKAHNEMRVKDLKRHLDAVQHRNKFGKIDYGPYMTEIQRKIKAHWHPPRQSETKEATVRFSVRKNGKLDGLEIAKTSGNDEVDKAALEAVRDAAPFDALPSGAPEKVEVEFSFDYNVLKHGQKQ